MNIILNFMDKIYSDSSTLSTIYIVGAVLLFVFIILLIFSLRKPTEKKKEQIIEEPVIDAKDNVVKIEQDKDEKKDIVENVKSTNEDDKVYEPVKSETPDLSSILEKTEIKTVEKSTDEEEKIEEKVELPELSADIPDVDQFVDNVVKKTYEKNEQFSSVYVNDNTSTMKLDKVLDKLNVEDDIKNEIVPEEEKQTEIKDEKIEEPVKSEKPNNNLDLLKKSLEEKKTEVSNKQDDLKAKLDILKNNTSNKINLNDLANKLKKD